MIRLVLLAFATAMGLISGALAETDCNSGKDCNIAARAALDSGDLPGARDAFRSQVDFATGEHNTNGGDYGLICDGLKNLARLSLQLGKPLRGHAWADIAETICAPDADLQAITATLAEKLRTMPNSDSIAGLYWDYAGYGQWNELTVTDRGSGQFGVQWAMKRYGLVRSAATDGPASMWDNEATGERKDSKLIVRYPGLGSLDGDGNPYGEGTPCELVFVVQPSALVVETDLPEECTNGKWGAYPRGTFWHVEAE